MEREFDLILFGATGFTGRLTAEYLARRDGEGARWAIAGRDGERLAALRDELAATSPSGGSVGTVEARLGDSASLVEMASRTRVLATTVGPYDRYGEEVLAACVETGTDYADITGEPRFVDRMRARYGERAAERGLRMVSCCGFDSIPHDLGALLAVRHLPADRPVQLEGFVYGRGELSGGTWHSAVEAMARLGRDDGERPRREPLPGGRRVRGLKPRIRYERRLGRWVCPLPTIDPLIVLRSARELPEYGPDFRYGHYLQIRSFPRLVGLLGFAGGAFLLSRLGPTRRLLLSWRRPGEGPSEEERERGKFRVVLLGEAGDAEVRVEVRGGDPGYGETSKMLAESALCLALDRDRLPDRAGLLTPAVAMGDLLIDRLRAADVELEVVEAG